MLKRADDDWQSRNGSIYCDISFGANPDMLVLSGDSAPKPFELLEISVLRTAGFRLSKTRCVSSAANACLKVAGIGDYGFFFKNSGHKPGTMPYEGIRIASGPYEITVIANHWKGGDPGPGTIALAKKLAQEYH